MSSIYVPKFFDTQELKEILPIIESYPFATVISTDQNSEPFFSHIPLLVNASNGNSFSLLGHVSKNNPQANHFKSSPKAHIIINGPHTYITPRWYKSGRDVPTWNYVAIHISGNVRIIDDAEGLIGILSSLSKKFESGSENPWSFELPEDLHDSKKLTQAIVGFEISVTKIEPKFKLSQNRGEQDRKGVIQGLSSRTDDMSKEIMKLMTEKDVFAKFGS